MPRTRIKICGVTRPTDAQKAAQLGADAVGMVFYPKVRRCITIETARQILSVLPPFTTPVALFVDQTLDAIRSVIDPLGIEHVQLHGDETPELVSALRDRIVLKAIKVKRETFEDCLNHWRRAITDAKLSNLRGLVLETAAGHAGGNGMANDWEYLTQCRQRGLFDGLPPLIAAGGLTAQSVAGVIKTLQPVAVDVSSGVEITPGCKDEHLLRDFIAAVNSTPTSLD